MYPFLIPIFVNYLIDVGKNMKEGGGKNRRKEEEGEEKSKQWE